MMILNVVHTSLNLLWRHTMKSVMMNASQKLAKTTNKKNRINCLKNLFIYFALSYYFFFVEEIIIAASALSILALKAASSLRKK